MDIATRQAARLAESLRHGQNELLEMIAQGAPLKDTLTKLMYLIEGQSDGVLCSVLLLDDDGVHIRMGAGPNLPPDYMKALDGQEIGPAVGSCGTAMYLKDTVIVSDILIDPLWEPYRHFAAPHGLRACWSSPIYLNKNKILGTFAMYYREVRVPDAEDIKLIGVAAHLAVIAIERTRREEELEIHRHHLTELVNQRTTELSAAKEKAEASNLALSVVNLELASALHNLNVTHEELVRRDKLAALGALVAGVAHELNTPIGNGLMVASTLADLTREFRQSYNDGLKRSSLETYMAEAAHASEILQRNLQRAADLVVSFKQIAVDGADYQRSQFALTPFIAETIYPLSAIFKKHHVDLKVEIPRGLEINTYPGLLSQVIVNILNNSLVHAFVEAEQDQQKLLNKQHNHIQIHASLDDAGWLNLSIKDNGIGINPAHLPHIYDPFFTTKLGEGSSGLGLHITHNIVTSLLNGKIDVDSSAESGTCFTIRFPL